MLIINDLSLRIAGRLLLDHASVTLPTGSKAGLVGRNGTGKTTLFNAITGEMLGRDRLDRPAQERAHRPGRAGSARHRGAADRDRAQGRHRAAGADDRGADGDRSASHRRNPHAACRHRRAFGGGARRDDPRRPRLRHRRAAAAGIVLLRRLAHARRAGLGAVCASPTCCCSTSRPTISTSKARCGWRITSRAIRTRCC